MNSNIVGAGILNIVTESLYDKPIVVFREYVQNSVDSFLKTVNRTNKDIFKIVIWVKDNDLFFLDNGAGIAANAFYSQMISIAMSYKRKATNLGYKGIGRLSGIPYCSELEFINICNYDKKEFQKYTISNNKYNEIKKSNEYSQMSFNELMQAIGDFDEQVSDQEVENISKILRDYQDLFTIQKTGFIVCLKGFNEILKSTMENSEFIEDLNWLLPVRFKKELLSSSVGELFEEITEKQDEKNIPAQAFSITFNGIELERPITESMLRDYVCKCDLTYAVCVHSFRRDKIAINKGNKFSGIRIYIDNMLLCDESELLPILQQYGFIQHTANELIQSVKGIGAMIYITDKVNISANARRTFIEVTDDSSIEFLKKIAEFIANIYNARYALSKYSSAKKNMEEKKADIDDFKEKANHALVKLAQESIQIDEPEFDTPNFNELNLTEQKQIVKQKIAKEINKKIRSYLSQANTFDYENAYEDFKVWLSSN